MFAVTVSGETCYRRVITARCTFNDEQQNSGSQNGTYNLGYYISGCILRIHFLANEYSDSHGRVNMAARDGADGINHCEQRQAESQRDAKEANLISRQNSAPA